MGVHIDIYIYSYMFLGFHSDGCVSMYLSGKLNRMVASLGRTDAMSTKTVIELIHMFIRYVCLHHLWTRSRETGFRSARLLLCGTYLKCIIS